MADVNLDRLRDLAGHLREACRELGELAALGEESFLAESRTINSAKYLLIVAAEAALDMCNHLAAKNGLCNRLHSGVNHDQWCRGQAPPGSVP